MEIPSVRHLKNKLSSRIIRVFFFFLIIGFLPGFIFSIKENLVPLIIFNITAFIFTLFMFLYKKSSYPLKIFYLLGCTYLVGAFLIFYKGPQGTGILYFFAFVCCSALFLNLRTSIILNVLSGITILGLGLGSIFLEMEWEYPYQASLVFTTHYIVISLVITTSTHYMLGGLKKYISQQKNMYRRLGKERNKTQAALEINETLYKELHHRVKNNLFLITNLLELHQMQNDNPEKNLRNIINRIHAISLVHDLLSVSTENEEFIAQNFVDEIIRKLFHSLARENIKLKTTISFEAACIETKRLSQLTLILNEIFTNSIKYAFPNNDQGLIQVTGKQVGESAVFTISDNGVGFNPESCNKNESLGLELIDILAHQMKGTCNCNSCSSGTVYTLSLPCKS